ncbi:DUF1798 family protein [Sediminibacillus massiliensis]|uniref:DUF1798 family protein n=1 Tax=Sediminibacillus massiliensis TaxID=1926277 RepID=UPI00098852AC|nr:DUF1798 family protein [Sediminibacillus massiliensis]
MEIQHITLQLKDIFQNLRNRYETNDKPEDRRDREFFSFVKKETTPVHDLIVKWEEHASAFVQNKQVSVHPQQVASTSENLQLLLLHSYYIDVKRKRYMELYQSVQYVFDLLLKDIGKQTS